MAKPIISRLRRLPERVVIGDGDGGSASYISTGLLQCKCQDCQRDFFVESFMGHLSCPYCTPPTPGAGEVEKTWTRPQVVLVPEGEASFLVYKPKRV